MRKSYKDALRVQKEHIKLQRWISTIAIQRIWRKYRHRKMVERSMAYFRCFNEKQTNRDLLLISKNDSSQCYGQLNYNEEGMAIPSPIGQMFSNSAIQKLKTSDAHDITNSISSSGLGSSSADTKYADGQIGVRLPTDEIQSDLRTTKPTILSRLGFAGEKLASSHPSFEVNILHQHSSIPASNSLVSPSTAGVQLGGHLLSEDRLTEAQSQTIGGGHTSSNHHLMSKLRHIMRVQREEDIFKLRQNYGEIEGSSSNGAIPTLTSAALLMRFKSREALEDELIKTPYEVPFYKKKSQHNDLNTPNRQSPIVHSSSNLSNLGNNMHTNNPESPNAHIPSLKDNGGRNYFEFSSTPSNNAIIDNNKLGNSSSSSTKQISPLSPQTDLSKSKQQNNQDTVTTPFSNAVAVRAHDITQQRNSSRKRNKETPIQRLQQQSANIFSPDNVYPNASPPRSPSQKLTNYHKMHRNSPPLVNHEMLLNEGLLATVSSTSQPPPPSPRSLHSDSPFALKFITGNAEFPIGVGSVHYWPSQVEVQKYIERRKELKFQLRKSSNVANGTADSEVESTYSAAELDLVAEGLKGLARDYRRNVKNACMIVHLSRRQKKKKTLERLKNKKGSSSPPHPCQRTSSFAHSTTTRSASSFHSLSSSLSSSLNDGNICSHSLSPDSKKIKEGIVKKRRTNNSFQEQGEHFKTFSYKNNKIHHDNDDVYEEVRSSFSAKKSRKITSASTAFMSPLPPRELRNRIKSPIFPDSLLLSSPLSLLGRQVFCSPYGDTLRLPLLRQHENYLSDRFDDINVPDKVFQDSIRSPIDGRKQNVAPLPVEHHQTPKYEPTYDANTSNHTKKINFSSMDLPSSRRSYSESNSKIKKSPSSARSQRVSVKQIASQQLVDKGKQGKNSPIFPEHPKKRIQKLVVKSVVDDFIDENSMSSSCKYEDSDEEMSSIKSDDCFSCDSAMTDDVIQCIEDREIQKLALHRQQLKSLKKSKTISKESLLNIDAEIVLLIQKKWNRKFEKSIKQKNLLDRFKFKTDLIHVKSKVKKLIEASSAPSCASIPYRKTDENGNIILSGQVRPNALSPSPYSPRRSGLMDHAIDSYLQANPHRKVVEGDIQENTDQQVNNLSFHLSTPTSKIRSPATVLQSNKSKHILRTPSISNNWRGNETLIEGRTPVIIPPLKKILTKSFPDDSSSFLDASGIQRPAPQITLQEQSLDEYLVGVCHSAGSTALIGYLLKYPFIQSNNRAVADDNDDDEDASQQNNQDQPVAASDAIAGQEKIGLETAAGEKSRSTTKKTYLPWNGCGLSFKSEFLTQRDFFVSSVASPRSHEDRKRLANNIYKATPTLPFVYDASVAQELVDKTEKKKNSTTFQDHLDDLRIGIKKSFKPSAVLKLLAQERSYDFNTYKNNPIPPLLSNVAPDGKQKPRKDKNSSNLVPKPPSKPPTVPIPPPLNATRRIGEGGTISSRASLNTREKGARRLNEWKMTDLSPPIAINSATTTTTMLIEDTYGTEERNLKPKLLSPNMATTTTDGNNQEPVGYIPHSSLIGENAGKNINPIANVVFSVND